VTAFVLAAGGTGGHLFPAQALADELLGKGCTVHLVTDERTDGFARDRPDISVHRVRAGRPGGGPMNLLHAAIDIGMGVLQGRQLLRKLEPAAVVGFGGYPSVPTMLAATQLGFPTVIHEQNAVLGRANRMLAKRANRIATGFPETAGLRPAERSRAVRTGNPVRPAIVAVGDSAYSPPEFGGPIELLIFGGSQGAAIFAEIVPAALALLAPALRPRLRVSQQARPEDRDAVSEKYRELGFAAEVESFFADMPNRLARAHLVICRAGASTIAELAAAGRPALLVPYPYATDDHQTANARAFANTGGSWTMPQTALSPPLLAHRLAEVLGDTAQLRLAAAQARGFACLDAAKRLATLVIAAAPSAHAMWTERAA
jgi:UDP-N-acetylglucosamine--N-acetylmuramyl-(pentapeptide) pyrophosphoryl-undecaprenol N-acetylglucosamine transferase